VIRWSNIRGVVRGRTIELDQPLALPEGSSIRSIVESVHDNASGQGLREAFGALADCAEEVDEFDVWYRSERHRRPNRSELSE
jgi:hypothetical protein